MSVSRNHESGKYEFKYTRVESPDWPDMVDAIADVDYVNNGSAVSMGINMDPVIDVVHAANMKKSTGPIRADGKRLKPAGWVAPDVAGEIAKQLEAAYGPHEPELAEVRLV